MNKKIALTAALVLLPLAAIAQTKTGDDKAVRHITGRTLDADLKKGMTADAFFSQIIITQAPAYRVINTTRDKPGEAEIHDGMTDHIFVQEGEATFVTGGTIAGSKVTAPGEHRGASIAGGTSRPMRPGDYFLIPAGTAHQMLLTPGKRIKFIAFKTKK
jgi:mannose-6-phosphate isomerase-like protein (cupin superfamily)